MRRKGIWMAVTATLMLGCACPFYWFFYFCPAPRELLQVRPQIRPGMTLAQVDKVMRPGYGKSVLDFMTGDPLSQASGFSGFLRDVESCSVQCQGILTVEFRDGQVTRVSLELYNDLDHSLRELQ